MNANVEQITDQLDLKELEKLLQNITYARLEREDIEDVGTDNILKLFRLA